MTRDELIKAIVDEEWAMFQQTENEGGRAECQNNRPVFNIMRKSQFMAWEDDLLKSYLNDLYEGRQSGRNLIMEKYGRMMESTAPAEYEKIKDAFIVHSKERNAIAEQVIAISVSWMEEFAGKYPKLSGQTRYIHSSEDTEFNTSAETYLRGELATYGETTFLLYCRYVLRLWNEGKNLNRMILENTALLYGYSSLDDAESKL